MSVTTLESIRPGKVAELVIDPRAEVLFGIGEQPVACPVEDWARAFHLYDPATRMPLAWDALPATRAMQEGVIEDQLVLMAPPGEQETLLRCSARATFDEDGHPTLVVVRMQDVTGLQRVGVERVDLLVLPCGCGNWQVDFPITTPAEWIREALDEHRAECIVMAATSIARSHSCVT